MNNIDYPTAALLLGLVSICFTVWRAQKNHATFDLADMLMENDRVSKIAVSYMLVLFVSTFVVLKMLYDKTLTDVIFGIYCGSWVAPLVARVVFNKTEPPATSTFTTTTQTRVVEPIAKDAQ